MNVLCMCPSSELLSVNCNNTGTLTADKHAHTCLKPRWRFSRGSASKKLTFRGLGKVSRSEKFSQKFIFERKSAIVVITIVVLPFTSLRKNPLLMDNGLAVIGTVSAKSIKIML